MQLLSSSPAAMSQQVVEGGDEPRRVVLDRQQALEKSLENGFET